MHKYKILLGLLKKQAPCKICGMFLYLFFVQENRQNGVKQPDQVTE